MGNAPSSSMEMTTDDTIDRLPNDMLVEIFSRMPYKSTCCCKCVSTSWRDLISHPDNRKLMPQSLAGFFYKSYSTRHFTNVSEKGEPLIDSSLPFLPKYESTEVLDCCNGLLLCRCWNSKPTVPKTMDYVVCNPATDKWVVVSATNWSSKVSVARLGFEPAVSSHFHVFEFVPWNVLWRKSEPNGWATDCLLIYSSKTGVWSNKDPPHRFRVPTDSTTVFLRGTLYVSAFDSMVVAFDFEGDYWRFIRAPVTPYIFHRDCPDDIFISQGQLYFTHKGDSELSIWVLEGENWTLKHSVSISAKKKRRNKKKHSISFPKFGELYSSTGNDYNIISIHPEHDAVFMVGGPENALIYMDSRELRFIRQLGRKRGRTSFIPYVPLFSKSMADGH